MFFQPLLPPISSAPPRAVKDALVHAAESYPTGYGGDGGGVVLGRAELFSIQDKRSEFILSTSWMLLGGAGWNKMKIVSL